MIVANLIPYIFDKVCIYNSADINHELYKGDVKYIPQDFYNKKVRTIGAYNSTVEIEIDGSVENEEDR